MPRSGKTALLKKIISNYKNKVGFVTNELRENGERTGFEIQTYANRKIILASTDFLSDYKVSKYFVNVKNLDLILNDVQSFKKNDLLYLDEIGQMELFSEKFKQTVLYYLNSENTCILTISKIFSNPFIEEIKKRNDVVLIEITEENRLDKQLLIEIYLKS